MTELWSEKKQRSFVAGRGNSFAERFPRRLKLEISERKRAGASGYEELMRSRESIRIERNDPKI